jgi:hypothetical protein
MSGGEHWRHPDTGHFSIDRIFGPQHLALAQSGQTQTAQNPFARSDIVMGDRSLLSKSDVAKVEGTGTIRVDVNAPKGTAVSAEAGGLFKNTEVSRQTQMEPAKSGPSFAEAAP